MKKIQYINQMPYTFLPNHPRNHYHIEGAPKPKKRQKLRLLQVVLVVRLATPIFLSLSRLDIIFLTSLLIASGFG